MVGNPSLGLRLWIDPNPSELSPAIPTGKRQVGRILQSLRFALGFVASRWQVGLDALKFGDVTVSF
jgi:hypothetical protein